MATIRHPQSSPLAGALDRLRAVPWRALFAQLPLPMLALAASYGVYKYSLLFVPAWVAIATAAAFELTYIGLSAQTDLSDEGRRRAATISLGAVTVSVLYNTLAGLLERNPEYVAGLAGGWRVAAEVVLALLHGAPLAIVAYFVADLLLHNSTSLSALIADLRAQLDAKSAEVQALMTKLAQASQAAQAGREASQGAAQAIAERDAQLADIRSQLAAASQAIAERDRQLAAASQASQDGGLVVAGRALSWAQLAEVTGLAVSTLRSRVAKLEDK